MSLILGRGAYTTFRDVTCGLVERLLGNELDTGQRDRREDRDGSAAEYGLRNGGDQRHELGAEAGEQHNSGNDDEHALGDDLGGADERVSF